MSRTIQAHAAFKAGAEIKGKFEIEYKGFKVKANSELFMGARGNTAFQANLSTQHAQTTYTGKGVSTQSPALTGNLSLSTEVTVGIRITGNIDLDIYDILDIKAGVNTFGGALAKAKAEISFEGTNVELGAEASAFLGAQITGKAKGSFKIGDREIITWGAEASGSAGLGASAGAHIKCKMFGNFKFKTQAGATVGLGGKVGVSLGIDYQNLTFASANAFWTALNDIGFKNKGRKWFLPLEENVKMCEEVRTELGRMLEKLYQNNESEIVKLERWKRLETEVSKTVKARNPNVAQICGRAKPKIFAPYQPPIVSQPIFPQPTRERKKIFG